MLKLAKLQEAAMSLRAMWAAKSGIQEENIYYYTQLLLADMDNMPQLGCKTAVIMGNTNATAIVVEAAVKAGHKNFIVIGGKPIGEEHPDFTRYVRDRLSHSDKLRATNQKQTEAEYAHNLLTQDYGVPAENIKTLPGDKTTNTGQCMRLLKKHEGDRNAYEFYTLAGYARRTLMTARRELGDAPVMAVHNCYPAGVTRENWHTESVARAHMTFEAAKCLGANPLYVQLGYAVPVSLTAELLKARQFVRKGVPCAAPAPAVA